MIEGNPHFTNLFGVLIGSTGNGRKGTSWSQVKRFLIKVDQNWLQTKVLGGIASGETIVERIKDDILDGSSSKGFDDPKKPLANNRDDKRLFIQEPEFSGLLKVSTRDGSIISQILRKSWDSDRIENQTKYDFSVCKEPHISLIGHITKEELAITFSKTEAASGFGNRFLYFEVARSKKLPFGGKIEDVNFGPEYEKIFRAIEFAKRMPLIKESPESRHIWPQIYNELTKEHPGLMGAMLNRAAPMVRRLSLIYAVLDCSKMIEVKHTLAALAVWSRSELTVEKIFKGMLSDKVATAILNLITESDTGVTRTQIRDLFSKNESKERIDMALETLEHAKLIYKESIPAGPTGGKPTEKWWLARFSR